MVRIKPRKAEATGIGTIFIPGSFRPNSSTGIVSGSVEGHGFSVARSDVGKYTITLVEAVKGLISAVGSARSATGLATNVTFGDYDAASKTLVMFVQQPATAAVSGTFSDASIPVAGYQDIGLTEWLEVISNDVPDLSDTEATDTHNAGGTLAKDTTPILERVNGATDKQMRIHWAATDVSEITRQIAMPSDWKDGTDIVLHFAVMASGSTDSGKTIDVQVVANPTGGAYSADTEMGGNITLPDDTALNELTLNVASANLFGGVDGVGVINVSLVPAAHANDAIYLMGCWMEYEKADLSASGSISATTTGQVWAAVDMAADVDNVVNFMLAVRQDSSQP